MISETDVRRAVLVAYRELVAENGYQPTAPEIAARSGVPFREIYELFPKLEGLRDPSVPKRPANVRLAADRKSPEKRSKNPTIVEATARYTLGRYERREITWRTVTTFRETFRLFARFVGEDRPVASVTRRDAERWVESCLHLAPRTLRVRIGTLKTFFKWCVIEELVKADPMVAIRQPKLPRYVPRGLRDDQVAEAIEKAVDNREKVVLLLMVAEGLRAIEVANLELSDIDFRDRRMVVHGKGGHERALPLVSEVAEAIESYLAERGDHDGFLIESYNRSYANPTNGVTSPNIAKLASTALKRVGIKESGHSLRHTFARRMLDAGASIRDVQVALGHVSIATSQVYLPIAAVADLRPLMEAARIRGAHTREPGSEPRTFRRHRMGVTVTDDPVEPVRLVDESERVWPGSVTVGRLDWTHAADLYRALGDALAHHDDEMRKSA